MVNKQFIFINSTLAILGLLLFCSNIGNRNQVVNGFKIKQKEDNNNKNNENEKYKEVATIFFGGMGTSCNHPEYQNMIAKLKEGLGQPQIDCYENKIVGQMREQADRACDNIKKSEFYTKAKEINLVGQSQGGLMARSVLENCDISDHTKFRNLLTIGTPNMGVSEVPKSGCDRMSMVKEFGVLCHAENSFFNSLAFTPLMQSKLATPGYVRDTRHMDEYREKSTFLASLNNERDEKDISEKHKKRVESLNQAMFVQFEQDEVVFPTISEIFGEVQHPDKKEKKELQMEDTDFYKENKLGLKTLKEQNKIQIVKINAKHTKYTNEHIDNIFIPFLKK